MRDFAEQIEHVAVGALNITASGLDADRIPVGDCGTPPAYGLVPGGR